MLGTGGLLLLAACRLGFEDTPATGGQADGRVEDAGLDDAGSGDAGGATTDASDARAPDAATGLLYVTFGEDSTADRRGVTRDTYLSGSTLEVGFNYGDDNRLQLERDEDKNALVAFDLAAQRSPPAPGRAPARAVRDRGRERRPRSRPASSLRAGIEGNVDGAPGVANWTQATLATAWTSPGATPATPVLGTFVVSQLGRAGVDLPLVLFDRWRNGNGAGVWLHLVSGDEVRFGSREGADGQRPRLVLSVQP
jgi:hypothetical protein